MGSADASASTVGVAAGVVSGAIDALARVSGPDGGVVSGGLSKAMEARSVRGAVQYPAVTTTRSPSSVMSTSMKSWAPSGMVGWAWSAPHHTPSTDDQSSSVRRRHSSFRQLGTSARKPVLSAARATCRPA